MIPEVELHAPPALSTPAEHIFDRSVAPQPPSLSSGRPAPRITDDELRRTYAIARTVRRLRRGGWTQVALQFPDEMLRDAPRVAMMLRDEVSSHQDGQSNANSTSGDRDNSSSSRSSNNSSNKTATTPHRQSLRFYILGDTSYSACCADEVAAEHVCADVIVHYGRACLSPTARLPVLYVFTRQTADVTAAAAEFERALRDGVRPSHGAAGGVNGHAFNWNSADVNAIVMADVTFQDHVRPLVAELRRRGLSGVLGTSVVRNPEGPLPNRRIWRREPVVDEGEDDDVQDWEKCGEETQDGENVIRQRENMNQEGGGGEGDSRRKAEDLATVLDLSSFTVLHIGPPPTALLMVLHSRVQALHTHIPSRRAPTDEAERESSNPVVTVNTHALIGRRYARLLSVATAGIIGILVNTLSVRNYLSAVQRLQQRIAAAGKSSYVVVVGKLNPAKLANFAEIDGWVVVGCWESGLVDEDCNLFGEDAGGGSRSSGRGSYFKPMITPFELDVALTHDSERVWGGEWWGGIEGIERWDGRSAQHHATVGVGVADGEGDVATARNGDDGDTKHEHGHDAFQVIDEDEDEPPEFDLRTGKLTSRSRPMRATTTSGTAAAARAATAMASNDNGKPANELVMRAKGDVAVIKGTVSPGAEFLRSQRTWQGLGSDFNVRHDDQEGIVETSTVLEDGRSGIARGYVVGDDKEGGGEEGERGVRNNNGK